MYRIAICDDEQIFVDKLGKLLRGYGKKYNEMMQIQTFNQSVELTKEGSQDFDIYLLDIQMPLFDGIELTKIIKDRDPDAYIIFVTSTLKYAKDGYGLGISDYLHKPVDTNQIKRVMDKALYEIKQRDEAFILVRHTGVMRKVYLRDIIHIDTEQRRVVLYTHDHKYETGQKMKEIEDQLQDYQFVRSHNTCMINMRYIEEIQREDIIVAGGVRLPLSRYKKRKVLQRYSRYIGGNRIW